MPSGDDLPDVLMDKSQIEQVVKNIVINAAQAMPRGGYITVSTRYFPGTDIVEMSFRDTGVGIPAEKQEKIFTPFFTTKTKGTGLGLAIARKIVETHGGRLNARSAPGPERHSPCISRLTRRFRTGCRPPATRSPNSGAMRAAGCMLPPKASHTFYALKATLTHGSHNSARQSSNPKKAKTKILLIADDETNIRRVLQAMFSKDGYKVHIAENGVRALEVAATCPMDVLITDLIMPDMNGVELLQKIKQRHPAVVAIMITAYATIKTCVDAMRYGASDYITKPFDMDEIRAVVKRAVTRAAEAKANAGMAPKKSTPIALAQPSSPAMREVHEMVRRAAASKATVLIRGESGTGKELIARALHEQSLRAKDGGPFVAVSCAALSETLLDSELFGHEKNAFTGAMTEKKGRFEMAHGGTLFLDEIGDISPSVQVKLLRVLQQREFERVGGTKTVKVDVRLVAATNKDLERWPKRGNSATTRTTDYT